MPNWAYNDETIYGPEKELEELYGKLVDWSSKNQMENGFGTKWIGNIVIGAGFETCKYYRHGEKFEPNPNALECRGRIINDFHIVKHHDGITSIAFSSETAWGEISHTWDTILAKHAPNCKYYFASVEHGMGIFVKRDYKDRFYSFDYMVDIFIEDDANESKEILNLSRGYYSHEDLVYDLQKLLRTNEKDFTKLVDDVFKKIDDGVYGSPRKVHLNISPFEVID